MTTKVNPGADDADMVERVGVCIRERLQALETNEREVASPLGDVKNRAMRECLDISSLFVYGQQCVDHCIAAGGDNRIEYTDNFGRILNPDIAY